MGQQFTRRKVLAATPALALAASSALSMRELAAPIPADESSLEFLKVLRALDGEGRARMIAMMQSHDNPIIRALADPVGRYCAKIGTVVRADEAAAQHTAPA